MTKYHIFLVSEYGADCLSCNSKKEMEKALKDIPTFDIVTIIKGGELVEQRRKEE